MYVHLCVHKQTEWVMVLVAHEVLMQTFTTRSMHRAIVF